ncbi:SRPBCC family protein [Flavisericum labens]|uniref:SRPBCC family protein n=1 Tax=Flavisericum labens TaxID=3377112 RepID=UPI00387A9387
MKNNLLFDFKINKENNTVNVEREFVANLDLVWDAWTKPELLDQWWAPKPYKAVTKSMDFKEGGTWLYYMLSPENQKHWCKNDYQKIEPRKSFTGLDAFCDENGSANEAMPRTKWANTFTRIEDDLTLVSVVSTYEKLSDLEQVINMGFQEGFTTGLNQLDDLLATLKNK